MSQLSRQIKKIGHYQLGDLLGRGSIGTVYKGLNLENGTLVAIKQVSTNTIREEQHKALHQEITLLKKLKHDNIVKYIDCIETDGFINIILEYIESGSLASILKKFGSFPESLVAIYIKQVLIGLDYLHQQGVVHRDIKGANILTTKDGVVKLADFGVATRLTDDEKSFSLVGTPYWMAPEIIEMRGHISTSCDIWSLGCTVIELLTGNPPYYELMQYPALFRIVQDPCPPLPDGISVECQDFLIKCFHKEPSERIDAKSLLNHSWIQVMQPNSVLQIIKSPNSDLPEEVTNTIRMHIDSQMITTFKVVEPSPQEEIQEQSKKFKDIIKEKKSVSQNIYSKIDDKQFTQEDIMQKNLQVASVAQSNFATIIDQGSFISIDGSQNPNHTTNQSQIQVPLVSFISPTKHKVNVDAQSPVRQSILRDSQLDSLRQLKFRKSQQQNPFQNQNGGGLNLHFSQGFWGLNEDGKVIREINEMILSIQQLTQNNKITDDEKLAKQLYSLIDLIQNYPKAKASIVNNFGLSCFLEIFEVNLKKFCCNEDVEISSLLIHQVLQLINQIVESDNELLEQSCFFGALNLIQQVASSEFPRNIRIEAAYFIGQLAYSSQQTLAILLSSGGIQSLLDFLEPNVEENQDLICLAIDSILLIYEHQLISNINLSRILSSNCGQISLRITVLVDNIFEMVFQQKKKISKTIQFNLLKYLNKALDILIIFAKCEDQYVKLSLCRFQIVKMLAVCLKKFLIDDERCFEIIHRIIKIFKYLSTEPTLIPYFENYEIITNSLIILDKALSKIGFEKINEQFIDDQSNYIVDFGIVTDLLKLIFYLTKLNLLRQQELALNEGIPLMLQLCHVISTRKEDNEDEKPREEMIQMKKVAMAILCSLVLSGEKSRKKLQEYGGITIFVDFLNEQIQNQIIQVNDNLNIEYSRSSNIVHGTITKLLDTLVNFVDNADDEQRMHEDLSNKKTIDVFIYCFRTVNIPTFQQIVPIFLKLLQISSKLCKVLVKQPIFCQALADYLKDQEKLSALTVKQLLDVLYQLLPFTNSPSEFLNKYNLFNICQRMRGEIGHMEKGLAVQQIAEMIGAVIEKEQGILVKKQKSWKQIDEMDKPYLQVKVSPKNIQKNFSSIQNSQNFPFQ